MLKLIVFVSLFINLSVVCASSAEPKVNGKEALVLAKAQELSETGKVNSSLETIEKSFDEKSSPALYFSAAIYARELNKAKKAEQYLRTCLEKMPKFDRARVVLGQILLEQEKFEKASKQFTKLVDSSYEDKSLVWKLLGYCLMQQENYQAAETAYKEALVRKPNDIELKKALIYTLLSGEKIGEIRPILKDMLSKDSKDSELWSLAYSVELSEGQRDKALEKLLMAEFIGATTTDMQIALATLLFENELYNDSAEIYSKLLKTNKLKAEQKLEASQAFISIENYRLAEILLNDETEFTAKLDSFLFLKGNLYKHQNQPKQAIEFLEKLLKNFPIHGEGLLALAELKVQEDEFDKAYDYLRRASHIDDVKRRALIEMAQILIAKKNYKKAVELLGKAQRIKFTENVEAYKRSVNMLVD